LNSLRTGCLQVKIASRTLKKIFHIPLMKIRKKASVYFLTIFHSMANLFNR
jgi:hypothetical protein